MILELDPDCTRLYVLFGYIWPGDPISTLKMLKARELSPSDRAMMIHAYALFSFTTI